MPAWVVPAAIAVGQMVAGLIGANRQQKANRKLAEYQAKQNESYLQAQLSYNTPLAQRTRMEEAGYNPNLFYGQGNPGNQAGPLSYPDIRPTDLQGLMQVAPVINQSLLTEAQVEATNAKTRHTYAMVELNKIQQKLLRANPLLNSEGFKAIIDSLKSSAEIKAQQSSIGSWQESFMAGNVDRGVTPGVDKMYAELDLLVQRFNLGGQDAAIKAQILKSKEFQNAILEVQKKFMTDAQITPQHILTFIQLLLMKMF